MQHFGGSRYELSGKGCAGFGLKGAHFFGHEHFAWTEEEIAEVRPVVAELYELVMQRRTVEPDLVKYAHLFGAIGQGVYPALRADIFIRCHS